MTKLTDSQLMLISSASAREDGAAVRPPRMMKAAAMKVGASLVARKLMREMRAKPGMPAWRDDEEGRAIALVITKAGLKVINADDGENNIDGEVMTSSVQASCRNAKSASKQAPSTVESSIGQLGNTRSPGKDNKAGAASQKANSSPERAGSKQDAIIGMLSRKEGATIDAMIAATGWLPHTTRAMLTGLRKKGFALERAREEGVTTYRIMDQPARAGA